MDNDRSFLKYKRYYTYIEPFFKTPIVRTYTILILSLLAVSFFIVFAIRPTIKTIISLNRQITDGKKTDQQLQDKINALSIAQSEYNQVTNDIPLIFSSLPENSSISPFLKLFEDVASSSGVSINSFQIMSVNLLDPTSIIQKGSNLKEVGFSTSVLGKYNNLLTFLELLRKIQRIVVIDNVVIGTNRSKDGTFPLQLTLNGKIYYYK